MKKAAELGAKVTYFAGPDGYIHDPDGVTGEKLDYILEMRAKDPMHCKPYADKYGVEFVPGEKCWGVKDVDVYMPAATQNDVRMESAEKIAASGVKYYIEVANMPTTNDALNFLREPEAHDRRSVQGCQRRRRRRLRSRNEPELRASELDRGRGRRAAA